MLKKVFIFLTLATLLFMAACSNDFQTAVQQDNTQTPTLDSKYGPATKTLLWEANFNVTGLPQLWNFDIGGGGWGNGELEYYTNRTSNVNCDGAICTITARKENYGGACGEIDIMEHINSSGQVVGTMHWDAGGHASYGGPYNVAAGNWNNYAIWWTPSYIRWFVNGNKYWEGNIANSINSTEEFHRPFFLLLNLAVGGAWPGSPNSSTAFPAQYQIDWVRWYAQ
jgi:beta-glucanase (GH16 family)